MKRILLLVLLLCPGLALADGSKVLDGTGDAYTIANPNVGNTNFSLCFYFYDDTFTDLADVINYGTRGSTGFRVHEKSDKLSIRHYLPGSQWVDFPTMSTSTWYHICITHTGSTTKVYLDATDATADVDTGADSYVVQTSSDDFYVGKVMPSDDWGTVNGSFRTAYVAYWAGVALSGAEVASLADKSTCPTSVQAASLEVFLPMTESGSVTDESGNGLTVVEEGNPTGNSNPTGLPCSFGAADNLPLLQAIGED